MYVESHPYKMEYNSQKYVDQSEIFDNFMQTKFSSFKRYGLDGSESFLVAAYALFFRSAFNKIEEIVIGMPHRGKRKVSCFYRNC